MPLLWVSQNFWTVASASFYRVNAVLINGEEFATSLNPPAASRRLKRFYESTHHLAEEVHIMSDQSRVFSGRALEVLSRAPFDNGGLQEARKLKFKFDKTDQKIIEWHNRSAQFHRQERQLEDESMAVFNISEFVKRVKQMAPKLCEIEIEYRMNGSEEYPKRGVFESLLAQLIQLGPRLVLKHLQFNIAARLPMGVVSDLVHIDIESSGIRHIAHLARQNAATLQTFIMKTQGYGLASELIKSVDGGYVCYPRLRVLKLSHPADIERYKCPSLPGALPFPNLQRLNIAVCYPFGDDVLFRENAAILESLVIETRQEDITMLIKSGVFTPTSHPKLQCVKIAYINFLYSSRFGSYTDRWKLLSNIAPNAAVRSFPGSRWSPIISSDTSVFTDYPNIQVLDLPEVSIEIWDAIALIKTLPLLSDLHSRMSVVTPPLADLSIHELLAYVPSAYGPMGQRFRCWHVNGISGSVTLTVRCVLLLALTCPNFDYCATPTKQLQEYMGEFEKNINSDMFKDHAPRLRRLLFTK
ncbi:hypothetical protein H4S03_001672 [Coemansia sp. S3946]|nr:hypothetical protein H4S03_001672 [Coemansia sp. S3946]